MNSKEPKQKKIRVGLTIIIVILLILAGIQLFLSFYLDSYVENQLTSAVSEQSNGQYELAMDDLNMSLWGRKLEMNNIRLYPVDDSSSAPEIELEQFSINRIQFLPYIFHGSIHVGRIRLSNPELFFVHNSPDSLTFLQSSGDSPGSENQPEVEVDQFIIDTGTVTYWNSDQNEIRGELNNFQLDISGIRVDSVSRSEPPYFQYSSIQISTGNIQYDLSNELYTVKTDGIDFSTNSTRLSVDSLKLIPRYPKYEFSEQKGHQIDRIDLEIEELLLEEIDMQKFTSVELKAEKFTVKSANLEVFHSKLLQEGPETEKTFPHMAFKNLGYSVTIDTVMIQQSEISYGEHLPEVSKPGNVTFADIYATFYGVTNDSSTVSEGHEITVDVHSRVMDKALLKVHIELPMHQVDTHHIRGSLEAMQAEVLNPVLEPVGLVRAENGTIHSLQFSINLGAEEASGWTQLIYSDLKMDILNEKDVDDGGRRRLKTFLANALKIKANNDEEPLRKGEVSEERNRNKSIFNYWWKSLSSGLEDNIGL